jgi:hypothetical protein
MVRHETLTFLLSLLACCVGVVIVLAALVLGFTFEATPSDMIDSAKGHKIAVPAVVALVTGVVALAGRRRRWGLAVGCAAAAAAVLAILLTILIPDGDG